jgi:hypothetical protein
MYYYQNSPTCFGNYCTIFREKFIVCSKLLLRFVITDIKMYYTLFYSVIYNYLKPIFGSK